MVNWKEKGAIRNGHERRFCRSCFGDIVPVKKPRLIVKLPAKEAETPLFASDYNHKSMELSVRINLRDVYRSKISQGIRGKRTRYLVR